MLAACRSADNRIQLHAGNSLTGVFVQDGTEFRIDSIEYRLGYAIHRHLARERRTRAQMENVLSHLAFYTVSHIGLDTIELQLSAQGEIHNMNALMQDRIATNVLIGYGLFVDVDSDDE